MVRGSLPGVMAVDLIDKPHRNGENQVTFSAINPTYVLALYGSWKARTSDTIHIPRSAANAQ